MIKKLEERLQERLNHRTNRQTWQGSLAYLALSAFWFPISYYTTFGYRDHPAFNFPLHGWLPLAVDVFFIAMLVGVFFVFTRRKQ